MTLLFTIFHPVRFWLTLKFVELNPLCNSSIYCTGQYYQDFLFVDVAFALYPTVNVVLYNFCFQLYCVVLSLWIMSNGKSRRQRVRFRQWLNIVNSNLLLTLLFFSNKNYPIFYYLFFLLFYTEIENTFEISTYYLIGIRI